ncbi:alpha/beta fold hydrolase [Bacteroidota bacterium]
MADWQMDLSEIDFPIALWYGKDDKMAPYHRGNYYNKTLANSTLKLIPNEGHFSLIRNHLDEILIELTQ